MLASFKTEIINFVHRHKTFISLVIIGIFIAIHIPILINHEAWSDETVSWELAKKITPGNIYSVNSSEPHPFLWQLILSPFAKNNFPIITLNVISLAFVALAGFLMLRFSPISPVLKILFLFSSSFFYFLPIISRDYSLIPLAICLVCLAYKKRHQKPFLYGLALLFLSQTHFLMYGLLGALVLAFLIETIKNKATDFSPAPNHKKRLFLFVLPLIFSVLVTFPIVKNSMQNQAILSNTIKNEYQPSFSRDFLKAFFPLPFNDYSYEPEEDLNSESSKNHPNISLPQVILSTVLLFVVFMLSFMIILKNKKVAFFFFSATFFWLITMISFYRGYTFFEQKIAILGQFLLFTAWMLKIENQNFQLFPKLLNRLEIIKFLQTRKKIPTTFFIACFLTLTIPKTFSYAINDFSLPFTSSKEIAENLDQLEPNSLLILSDFTSGQHINSAVFSRLSTPLDVYNIVTEKLNGEDYLYYSNEVQEKYFNFQGISDEALAKIFEQFSAKYQHIYYAVATPSCQNAKPFNYEVMKKYQIHYQYFFNTAELMTETPEMTFYKIK